MEAKELSPQLLFNLKSLHHLNPKQTMNKYLRNIIILVLPFLIVILVNEYSRSKMHSGGYFFKGITPMNSGHNMPGQCNWSCHNNTAYCKTNHVHFLKPYFDIVDPVYFGMIKVLKGTGNYQIANIIFLMFLWPIFMFVLLIKSIDLFIANKALKKMKKL